MVSFAAPDNVILDMFLEQWKYCWVWLALFRKQAFELFVFMETVLFLWMAYSIKFFVRLVYEASFDDGVIGYW